MEIDNRRLAIVVPYRNRPRHLNHFLAHLGTYFDRDEFHSNIPVSIHVIEQLLDAPFNGGKLKNCGYVLARDCADYFCFHDVDYLPIRSDYSWSDQPARLCWYGLRLKEDYENFFGAVLLFSKDSFQAVNGYPNCYWGWGFEDIELRQRLKFTGMNFEKRDGTYEGLPHAHAGYDSAGVFTREARRNLELYRRRSSHLCALMDRDGLSSLEFNVVERLPIQLPGRFSNSFHYKLHIGTPDEGGQ